jgi:hypothetical protein
LDSLRAVLSERAKKTNKQNVSSSTWAQARFPDHPELTMVRIFIDEVFVIAYLSDFTEEYERRTIYSTI